MTHTPGPWRVFASYDPLVIATDDAGEKIAYMSDRGYEPTNANARLIASAPDLLEALQSYVAWVEDVDQPSIDPEEMIRAAIAKATETPDPVPMFICSQCSYSFRQLTNFYIHMKAKHHAK